MVFQQFEYLLGFDNIFVEIKAFVFYIGPIAYSRMVLPPLESTRISTALTKTLTIYLSWSWW